MKPLTEKESEALLVLFKNYNIDYNANTLSKKINVSPRGALKILNSLKNGDFLKSKSMGKAIFYKLILEDYYVIRTIETLLIKESREIALRWLHEFRDIEKDIEIVIIFGGILKDENKANDIDLLIVLNKERYKRIKSFIEEKNKLLTKPIHAIIMEQKDFKNNLENEVVLNALSSGIILYGHENLIKEVNRVTRF